MLTSRSLESRIESAYDTITGELKASGRRTRGFRAQGLSKMRPEEAAVVSHLLLTAIKRDVENRENRSDELHLALGVILALSGPVVPREAELWRRLQVSVDSARPFQRTSAIAGLSVVFQAGSPDRRAQAGDLLAAIPVSRMDAFEWLDLMEDAGMYSYPAWREGVARVSLENPFMAERAVQPLDTVGVIPILQAMASQPDESLVRGVLTRLAARRAPP